jgi:hypothetical protein
VPARLHHEPVATGQPSRWLLFAHGIYGSGANLRTVARKIVEKRPEWGVELVDLRLHGRSDAGDPPHGIAACADDLAALHFDHGVDALAGHSFGGKVVLAARELIAVRQTWMLDASPSARPGALDDPSNSVAAVLAIMERLPKTWARREEFVAAVVAEGQAPALAQWLAMNLVPSGGALALRLDLPAVRAMLVDYYARDLWRELEDPARGEVVVVIADRSGALTTDDRARLAAAPPHVAVEHVDAAHWLHAEAPDAVAALFAARLP